jgi:hypothetical protein
MLLKRVFQQTTPFGLALRKTVLLKLRKGRGLGSQSWRQGKPELEASEPELEAGSARAGHSTSTVILVSAKTYESVGYIPTLTSPA